MNNDDIDKILNEIHNLRRELDIKKKMESEMEFEIDRLSAIVRDLKEKERKYTENISRLTSKVENFSCQLESLDSMRTDLQFKSDKIDKLNSELHEKNELIKSLESIPKVTMDSPGKMIKHLKNQHSEEIKELYTKIENLNEQIKYQELYRKQIECNFQKESEILKSQIEENRDINNRLRNEKEELEGELINLQNEKATPDFNRQGNNLYAELDDRRIKVENRLKEVYDDINRHKFLSSSLQTLLEKSFNAFSQLKEQKYLEKRRIIDKNLSLLEKENRSLKRNQNRVSSFIEKHINSTHKTFSHDTAIEGLKLELNYTKSNMEFDVKKLKELEIRCEKAEQEYIGSLEYKEQLLVEHNKLHLIIGQCKSKIDIWDRIASNTLKHEFENEWKQVQAAWKKNDCLEVRRTPMLAGTYGQTANKNSELLQMDPRGVPVENRLLKQVRNISYYPRLIDAECQCDEWKPSPPQLEEITADGEDSIRVDESVDVDSQDNIEKEYASSETNEKIVENYEEDSNKENINYSSANIAHNRSKVEILQESGDNISLHNSVKSIDCSTRKSNDSIKSPNHKPLSPTNPINSANLSSLGVSPKKFDLQNPFQSSNTSIAQPDQDLNESNNQMDSSLDISQSTSFQNIEITKEDFKNSDCCIS